MPVERNPRRRKAAIKGDKPCVKPRAFETSMDDPLIDFDVECVYRMAAILCGSILTGQTTDHTRAMAVADSILKYIDPLLAKELKPTSGKAKK